MAKKELFWLGAGVININGKDYGAEMPLPTGELNKDDLAKMVKDGRIGEKIAPVQDVAAAAITELQGKVKELTDQAKLDAVEIKELTDQAGKDGEKITGLETKVAELEKELEDATKPADDGATGDGKK